ncbi:GAF and ANTAR domain-containing protein [Streptomyces ochraceiscleroticus]|uniref:GAF and ANTAR domain-containing protein n=1 Tax=Streptomyces ochraceiscleroticus TaxID=47761 RepID=A0ABW1MV18_9ACTN|nr:GAF and ANTAR domain-containing protein [Streptomyces ochraceiscleroticus]
MTTPAQQIADVFVELSGGTAGTPLEVPELLATLARCSPGLLGVRAAGTVVALDDRAEPQVAGSEDGAQLLKQAALKWGEGPGTDSRRSGRPVPCIAFDGQVARQRWPRYAPRALELGYTRATAFPLRTGERSVGALVLLGSAADAPVSEEKAALAQSLADFAALTLMRDHELHASRALSSQLEYALNSRVIIEQAKGVLANRHSLTVDRAFALLRGHARAQRRLLSDVAHDVVEGRLDLG